MKEVSPANTTFIIRQNGLSYTRKYNKKLKSNQFYHLLCRQHLYIKGLCHGLSIHNSNDCFTNNAKGPSGIWIDYKYFLFLLSNLHKSHYKSILGINSSIDSSSNVKVDGNMEITYRCHVSCAQDTLTRLSCQVTDTFFFFFF